MNNKKNVQLLFFISLTCLIICVGIPTVRALTISIQVGSQAGPWDTWLNPSFDYGIHDNISPVVIDETSGLSFAPGNSLTITYISGTVSAGLGWSWVDAAGDNLVTNGNTGSSGTVFPSKYMQDDWDTHLMELVGAFADSSGTIIGNPFEIGLGRTVIIPSGATRLQLGINDDIFRDNKGAFEIKIEGSPVPISGPIWLLGAGFISLFKVKRRKEK